MRKLLLEDFWDDIEDEVKSQAKDTEQFDDAAIDAAHKQYAEEHKKELQALYPYYILVRTTWKHCDEQKNRTIFVERLEQRVESILASSHLFKNFSFDNVFIKSSTNRSNGPDPVTFYEENLPQIFDGRLVLINDANRYTTSQSSSYYDVAIQFKFMITGMREQSKERFAENIRIMMKKFRHLYPEFTDSAHIAFCYNNYAENFYDEYISVERDAHTSWFSHFSTDYPYCLERIDELHHVFFDDDDDKQFTDTRGRITYLRNLYNENLLQPIIKNAVSQASKYNLSVRSCKERMVDFDIFINQDRDKTLTWCSFVLNTKSGVDSVDVTDIEEWVINEIIVKFDHDFIDMGHFCVAIRCDCKVTNNREEEIAEEWKKNHS